MEKAKARHFKKWLNFIMHIISVPLKWDELNN